MPKEYERPPYVQGLLDMITMCIPEKDRGTAANVMGSVLDNAYKAGFVDGRFEGLMRSMMGDNNE